MVSSLLANFITLDKFAMLTPRTMLVSALKVSNPSWDKFKDTRATWELSIAWREMPIKFGKLARDKVKDRKVTLGSDINVDVGDEVLNGFDDLFEDDSFGEFCLEHILG